MTNNFPRFAAAFILIALGCDSADLTPPTVKAAPPMKNAEIPVSPKDGPEFQETKSGLKYRILKESDGKKPKATDTVRVHYHGWLDNGKVFDSSFQRNEPISFGLNQVVKGWTEGLQLVGKGGRIELVIPGKLGYGAAGHPPVIPPNATLHFIVDLLDIE